MQAKVRPVGCGPAVLPGRRGMLTCFKIEHDFANSCFSRATQVFWLPACLIPD